MIKKQLMIRFTTIIFLISLSISSAQIIDSVATEIILYPDSVTIKKDSLSTVDSSFSIVKRDSLKPIQSFPLTEKSYLISRDDLLKMEYRYTGDYLRLFPFNFIKDLGFPGQPNETFLYGLGNNSINFLLDGISYNDRSSNSFNLNLIQSEDIDSIEIIPLPRGFLYGAYNNPVSVNFITRDFITRQPYSRIRYYQGPDRETMLDGSFNLQITKKLFASFDITNRIVDSTYKNTEFSIWQGKVKLKYFLSNDINIIASYNYNDYKAGYSGGVDVDSISRAGQNINNVLYDFIRAPILYPNGQVKTTTKLPRLRFLIKPTDWLESDVSAYYLYCQNEKNAFVNEYSENKTYGINIRNNADYAPFNFKFNLDYENVDQYNSYSFYDLVESTKVFAPASKIRYDVISASGILSANFGDGRFIPTIFYKISSIGQNPGNIKPVESDNHKSSGFGVDITFKAAENLNFYFGYSVFNTYFFDKNSLLLEAGTKYKSDFFMADIKYFVNQYSYGFYTGGIFFDYIRYGYLNGLGLNLKFNYWKLLLESNSSYYFSADNNKLFGVPEFQTQTGIYYKDILFDNNLDLKTGFVFYYTGKNNLFTNEHGVLAVPSSNKLDFTLAGEIQKTAIIYFLWQNLLGNNYYITPYYPMPSRSIRFGVAWELFN